LIVAESGNEKPLLLQVQGRVVQPALHVRHGNFLEQFQGSGGLSVRPAPKSRQQNQKQGDIPFHPAPHLENLVFSI